MNASNSHKQITDITRKHLGLAAERFVVRQIREHTREKPAVLQQEDLQQLIDWIELAMRTAYSDQHVIDTYVRDLRALAVPNTGGT